jgi:short-subunit dehydrogenase
MSENARARAILITGASEGIGRALALVLARPGTALALAARNVDALRGVAEACESKGARALALPTDVSLRDACRRLVEETADRFGGLDVLVNNAGLSMTARFDEITDLGLFERIMAVNYFGTVYCTYYALPALKASKGLVVAVSSLQGKTGFPRSTGYAASKFAVQGFCDSLRIELAGTGVDVLVASPGPVATDIHVRKLSAGGVLETGTRLRGGRGLMSADECARRIAHAIERRKRDLVFTAGGKLLPWLKLFAPRLVDRAVARAVERFYREIEVE